LQPLKLTRLDDLIDVAREDLGLILHSVQLVYQRRIIQRMPEDEDVI